LYGCSNTLTNL